MSELHPLLEMEDDLHAVRELLETAMQLFASHLGAAGDLDHSIACLIYRAVRCADEKNDVAQAKWNLAIDAFANERADKCWSCDGPADHIHCGDCNAPAFPKKVDIAA